MPTEKPNVLLILADDVGWFDVGAYATFEDFPPRQPPPDFNPQQMLERVLHATAAQ